MDHPFREQHQVVSKRLNASLSTMPALPVTHPLQAEEATLLSFVNDVAMGLAGMDVIAARYGVTLMEAFAIAEVPEVARRIKTRRALWESEDNVVERNRVCYGLITLEAAAVLDRQLHHPGTPASTVIDGLKVAGKFAGLDTQPRQNGADSGPGLAPVTIQINFSGGKTESIAIAQPPTIEGEAA
jgi:hypothetical protein